MKLIDTHTHIYQSDFNNDISEVIEKAQAENICKLLLPNIDVESIAPMHKLCDAYPDICFPMMGLHPTSIKTGYSEDLQTIKQQFESRKYIAIGEIGIDLYWDKTYLKEQIEAFEKQLNWSIELDLPVVIHCRKAFSEIIQGIKKVGTKRLRGVFHSFGGSKEELKVILSLDNFMMGINGVVTFNNSKLKDYLEMAPLDKIVLETDAPYLSPVPYRGERNEPSYLVKVAEKLTGIYQLPIETIAEKTTQNALTLFSLT